MITTSHKTLNKTLKREIVKLFPSVKFCNKKHVAGCGYVWFFKDENMQAVCKAFKGENGFVLID